MKTKEQGLPRVVSREEWRVARESLLDKEFGKPAFYHVQPAGTGGNEVDLEARMAFQPALNRLGLVLP
jgi:hypothetical protein